MSSVLRLLVCFFASTSALRIATLGVKKAPVQVAGSPSAVAQVFANDNGHVINEVDENLYQKAKDIYLAAHDRKAWCARAADAPCSR